MQSPRKNSPRSSILVLTGTLLVLCLARPVHAEEDPLKLWLTCDQADIKARKHWEGLNSLAIQRDRCVGTCTDLRRRVEDQERESDRLYVARAQACYKLAQTHPYLVNLRLNPEVCPQDYKGPLIFKDLDGAVASGLKLESCVQYYNPSVEPHRYYNFEWAAEMLSRQETKALQQRCEQSRLCADRTDEYTRCGIFHAQAGTWKDVQFPLCTNGRYAANDPVPPGIEQAQHQLTLLCKKGDKDACAVLTAHGVDPAAPLPPAVSKSSPATKTPQQCGAGTCSPSSPKTAAAPHKDEAPLHPFFIWMYEPELSHSWEYKPKRRGTLFYAGMRTNFKVQKSDYSGYYDPFASADLVVGMSAGNFMRIRPIVEVALGTDLTDEGIKVPRITVQNGFEVKILQWLKVGLGFSIQHNFTTMRLVSTSGQRTVDISPLTAYGIFYRIQLLPFGSRVRFNLDYRSHRKEVVASDLLAIPPDSSPHELSLTVLIAF